ncbi:MAG: hypothetical protein ACRYGR_10590 [Janthinobacterium lividum]
MAKEREKKDKIIKVRVNESLFDLLQKEARSVQMSLSGYVNFILTSSLKKYPITFDEKVGKVEKKDTRIRVCLTASETDLLQEHATQNDWSLTKEVRYRIVSSLAQKPKLTQEELKAIHAIKSSINVLGTNINRLVREGRSLSDHNINICQELMTLMTELKDKISYLEKCGSSNFKLKVKGRVGGR